MPGLPAHGGWPHGNQKDSQIAGNWYDLDPRSPTLDFDTGVPHPARIYDYWLGGKDNFAADREAAEHALSLVPEFRFYEVGNRKFLGRAAEFLVQSGIRQFLDLGTRLPTSPNVHEVAQDLEPDCRVVYVDNDPIVAAHASALLATDEGTIAVLAAFRDADAVLAKARQLLDFSQPVAVIFVASLHHVSDDDPAAVVGRYLDAVVPGSYLVLSHCTDDMASEGMRRGPRRPGTRESHSSPAATPRSYVFQRPRPDRARAGPGVLLAPGARPTRRERGSGLRLRRGRPPLTPDVPGGLFVSRLPVSW